MRRTLTIVLVGLLASVGAAQTSTPQEPKTGRNDFDQKGPSGSGGLGGVRAKINTRKLYEGGFPRAAIPTARHAGPIKRKPAPRPKIPATMDRPRPKESPDLLGVKPEIDLINRNKFDIDDLTMQPDRAPLQVLEQPRRLEPQVINCRPVSNPCRDSRLRQADRPVIVKTSDGLFRSGDRERLTPMAPAPKAEESTHEEEAAPGHAEFGDLTLVGQRPEAAIAQLQAYLTTYPDDFHAMRLLALALLANRNAGEAAMAMGRAYAADPLLAKDAISPSELGLEGAKVVSMVRDAQASASKTGANAWLMVLALQQGQGQTSQALATLEKAKRAGLSHELAERFAASLATRAAERAVK